MIPNTSSGPLTHPVVISPVPKPIIEIDILRSCENTYIGSLTCELRDIMVGKTKWNILFSSLQNKIMK